MSSLLLLAVKVAATDLGVLLKPQIEDAKCHAKCLKMPDIKEKSICFNICKLTQETHMPDICKFPQFCTGACKVACQNVAENEEKQTFESFSVSQCGLSWRIGSETKQNVVFVLAGEDQGGMWNIIFSSLVTSRIGWGHNFVSKYVKLNILAVGAGNILDELEIVLPRNFGKGCEGDGVDVPELPQMANYLSFVTLISYCMLLISILVCIISLVLWRKSKDQKTSQSTENLIFEI